MRVALAILAAMFSAGALSCSDASGVVRGGEALVVGPPDPCADGGTSSTWTDLYTCYFGPTGKASCSAQGTCHGDSSQSGALTSGFVCGTSKDACWQGMTQDTYCANAEPPCPIVPPGGSTTFKTTGLYKNLAKVSGGGNMPQNGSYLFTDADLARIAQWISDGAKND
jgi:hypothetical protein